MYRTDEGGRRKCGQYWPLEVGGQEVYGHIAVINQSVDKHSHYNKTTLELHNTEVRSSPFIKLFYSSDSISLIPHMTFSSVGFISWFIQIIYNVTFTEP